MDNAQDVLIVLTFVGVITSSVLISRRYPKAPRTRIELWRGLMMATILAAAALFVLTMVMLGTAAR